MKTPPTNRTPLPVRTWFVIALLSLSGQIAWGVENAWFNTFVFDIPDTRPTTHFLDGGDQRHHSHGYHPADWNPFRTARSPVWDAGGLIFYSGTFFGESS